MYCSVAICSASYLGVDVLIAGYPLTHYRENYIVFRIVNIVLMGHCMIACYMCGHIFMRCILDAAAEVSPSNEIRKQHWPGSHIFATLLFVSICFIMSYVVPSF